MSSLIFTRSHYSSFENVICNFIYCFVSF